jgi:CRISPR-associated protein Csb2
VWAPEGFDEAAMRALEELTWLSHIGDHPLQVVLLGLGVAEDFRLPVGAGSGSAGTPLVGAGRVWTSLTPFVPTRHPRSRGTRQFEEGLRVGGAEHDLRRLLRAAGFPEPVQVHQLPECRLADRTYPWNRFRTRRLDGGGLSGSGPAVGWRLVFAESVSGPLCVGYGSHFGLGVFVPEAETSV